jgi:hypothetical protein
VTTAFAASCPSLLLAEPAGFFGLERPMNCFTGPVTQFFQVSWCLFQLPFQLSTRVILTQQSELSTPKSCANSKIFGVCESQIKTAKNAAAPKYSIIVFQISTAPSTSQGC